MGNGNVRLVCCMIIFRVVEEIYIYTCPVSFPLEILFAKTLSNVVLPLPDGPMIATSSPA
jgi:hypothetical protein